MPNDKILSILKMVILSLIYILLTVASLLSFLSMSLIVSLYFTPTLSYSFPIIIPMFIALFLFASQLIPGYFAIDKKYMLITLILSAVLVGVLFSVLLGVVKGLIYGAACGLGNYIGFYFRMNHE